MQTITPFLWFDGKLEDAIEFYKTVFSDVEISDISRYGEGGPYPSGTAMSATFKVNNQHFMALNAGPQFKFSEAISFFVSCEDQEEVDNLWDKLTADGGEEGRCGWLKDKFGLSWQIIPTALGSFLGDQDPKKSQAALGAMMQMNKIDISALQAARDNA
jgi:predicted 3-demethylubiquinone-9 3-methyltransferase (glyoxalase superfamily)